MSRVFLTVLNMSIAGGILILAVLFVRLLLRKAPKWTRLLLWGIVGLRLALPFFPESRLSLMPRAGADPGTVSAAVTKQTDAPAAPAPIETRAPALSSPSAAESPAVTEGSHASQRPAETSSPSEAQFPFSTDAPSAAVPPAAGIADGDGAPPPSGGKSSGLLSFFACVWISGTAAMLAYAAISCALLKKKLATAVRLEGNVYEADAAKTPFLLGIFAPKIYFPFGVDPRSRELVLRHEKAHIKAFDHVIKPLGWAILAVHWFDPLAWLAFWLFSRDIELACDERVIKKLDPSARADYSEALLSLSLSKKRIAACPLAFGGSDVKERVKNVLNYKKPAVWIMIAAILASLVLAGCFLTKPKNAGEEHRIMPISEAAELADENGWVVIPDDLSYSIAKGADRWDGFIDKVNSKEPAEVVLAVEKSAAILTDKYKSIGGGSSSVTVFEKISYDGTGFTLRESFVYPLDFETEARFAYLGYAFYPGGECWEYYLSDEPLVDVSSDESFALYQGNAHPLFKLSNKNVPRDGEPYAYAAEHGWAAVDTDGRFACGRAVWTDFYDNYLNGVPAEVTVVHAVPEEDALSGTGPKEKGTHLIVISRVRYDGEKLYLSDSTGIDEFGEEREFIYLEEKSMESEERESFINYYLTRTPIRTLLIRETQLSEDEIVLLLSVCADEIDMDEGYADFGYRPDKSSIIAEWPVDLDGDGVCEIFHADLGFIVDDSFSFAWVTDASGRLMGNMMLCGSGHTALNTFALVESPEYGMCIMSILPEWGGQTYGYQLMKVVNGEFKPVFRNLFWQFGDEEPLDWNTAEAQAYEDEVNALLDSGYVLITTDRSGVMRGELWEQGTCGNDLGRPIEFDPGETLALVSAMGSTGDWIEKLRSSEYAKSFYISDHAICYHLKAEPYTDEPDVVLTEAETARLTDEAWELAEEASKVHGVTLIKENRTLWDRMGETDLEISFESADHMALFIAHFTLDEDGSFKTSLGDCKLYVTIPGGTDIEKLQRDLEEICVTEIMAKYSSRSDGASAPEDLVPGDAARQIEALFTGCSEDNYLRCSEAHAVSNVLKDGRVYEILIVVKPVNEWFSGMFCGMMGTLYDDPSHPEWRGFCTLRLQNEIVDIDHSEETVTVRLGPWE